MVHGMVDNYLYNGKGAIFSLLFVGLSMWVVSSDNHHSDNRTKGLAYNNRKHNLIYPVELFFISVIFILILSMAPQIKILRSAWHANLGAIRMAKYDLVGFPERGWDDGTDIEVISDVKFHFDKALQLDPYNVTANYRLGKIIMMQKKFHSAVEKLEIAYLSNPDHRGIKKNLAYCYLWSNNKIDSEELLVAIPEAKSELDAYAWWWDSHNEPELSRIALEMSSVLSQK